MDDELARLAGYQQTSVSLKATLDTGLGLLLPSNEDNSGLSRRQRTLIQIATFLRRELPVRLARRVIELEQLPEGLHSMPSVQRVREWYIQSFVEIRRSKLPVDVEVRSRAATPARSGAARAADNAEVSTRACGPPKK